MNIHLNVRFYHRTKIQLLITKNKRFFFRWGGGAGGRGGLNSQLQGTAASQNVIPKSRSSLQITETLLTIQLAPSAVNSLTREYRLT